MTEHSKEWNEKSRLAWNKKSLRAWNQWKEICSIRNCSAEYSNILTTEVLKAFKRKIRSVVGCQLDFLFSPQYDSNSAEKEEREETRELFFGESGCFPEEEFHEEKDGDGDGYRETVKKDVSFEYSHPDNVEKEVEAELEQELEQELEKEDSKEPVSSPGIFAAQNFTGYDWACEFDAGIVEKANISKTSKNYKDHTWECILRSDDPPLKIIRGQLVGPKGIINEIAERFLRCNYPQIWEKQSSVNSQIVFGDNDSDELGNIFSSNVKLWQKPLFLNKKKKSVDDEKKSVDDEKKSDAEESETQLKSSPMQEEIPPSPLDRSDKEYLKQCFSRLFTWDNAAILLVSLTDHSSLFKKKISLAIPELKECIGLKSSSPIYNRLDNVIYPAIRKLPKECLGLLGSAGTVDFLVSLLIEQIRQEKKAASLLLKIEAEMKSFNGEEKTDE